MSRDHTNYRGKKRSQFWTVNDEEDLCVQSDKHLASIQTILKKFNIGGQDMLDDVEGAFMDVSEFTDFHDLNIQTKEAEAAFMKLPSKVREIFDHDVYTWLDSAHDQEKRDELVARGFLKVVEADPKTSTPGTPGGPESDGRGTETA